MSEKEKRSPMTKRDKMIVIIMFLVFATFLQYYITTSHNQSVFDKMPTGLTQPSLDKQCKQIEVEIKALEEHFALIEPENISISDTQYYKTLQNQAQKLGC